MLRPVFGNSELQRRQSHIGEPRVAEQQPSEEKIFNR
jgi:hypothetical protein